MIIKCILTKIYSTWQRYEIIFNLIYSFFLIFIYNFYHSFTGQCKYSDRHKTLLRNLIFYGGAFGKGIWLIIDKQ